MSRGKVFKKEAENLGSSTGTTHHTTYHLTLWRGESLVVSAMRSRRSYVQVVREYWIGTNVHIVCLAIVG